MTDPKREYHILSLGAGVQSTMLALLSHRQDAPKYVPRFDCAIFADTQEEPAAVYRHLEWLTAEVAPSFPVIIATAGKLGDDLIHGKGDTGRVASLPVYTATKEGEPIGITVRQCSMEYKVNVVERTIRRTVLGLKPRQRVPKPVTIHQYIGLSAEEGVRIFGRGTRPGVKHRIESRGSVPHFPLYDMLLKREQIQGWLSRVVPHETPRSACVFCPYHSDAEWQRIKDNDPDGWARSLEIDEALRNGAAIMGKYDQNLYLHRSCIPLKDVVLRPQEENDAQGELNFSVLECEGMCGL